MLNLFVIFPVTPALEVIFQFKTTRENLWTFAVEAASLACGNFFVGCFVLLRAYVTYLFDGKRGRYCHIGGCTCVHMYNRHL